MLLAAKFALGPVLMRQARVVRRTALRLPEAPGAREGVAGQGAAAVRLLVIGDSAAAGVGLQDQSHALAQPLAVMLAERLGTAVSWRLLARTGVNTAQARSRRSDQSRAVCVMNAPADTCELTSFTPSAVTTTSAGMSGDRATSSRACAVFTPVRASRSHETAPPSRSASMAASGCAKACV